MRVVVVYGPTLFEQTVSDVLTAIEPHHTVSFIQTLGECGYWQLLSNLWHAQNGFLLIEGDMGVTARMARSMIDERHGVVAAKYSYSLGGTPGPALGLIRFSDACVRRNPEIIQRAWASEGDGCADGSWKRLDRRVYREIERAGLFVKVKGETQHYHVYAPNVTPMWLEENGYLARPDWQDRVRARFPHHAFGRVER